MIHMRVSLRLPEATADVHFGYGDGNNDDRHHNHHHIQHLHVALSAAAKEEVMDQAWYWGVPI